MIALIADTIGSKGIAERGEFQQQLKKVLENVSENSSAYLLSPYTITLGDEFQAVYSSFDSIMYDMMDILEESYPQQMRFAIGYDTLSTSINPEAALGMDGPAFHIARAGMEQLKELDRTVIQFYGSEIPSLEIVNHSLNMFSLYMEKWKDNTFYTFASILKDKPVEDIARRIGITVRGTYKHINMHHLREYIHLFQIITYSLTKQQ